MGCAIWIVSCVSLEASSIWFLVNRNIKCRMCLCTGESVFSYIVCISKRSIWTIFHTGKHFLSHIVIQYEKTYKKPSRHKLLELFGQQRCYAVSWKWILLKYVFCLPVSELPENKAWPELHYPCILRVLFLNVIGNTDEKVLRRAFIINRV